MRRYLLAGGAVLAVATAASTQSTPPSDEELSPAEIISKLTPADILPRPLTPEAGPKPDPAPKATPPAKPETAANKPDAAPPKDTPKPGVPKPTDVKRDPDGLERCLSTWDVATHMTRGEWARVCRQIVVERRRRTAAEQSKP
jgi:hypothetical protein